jgi:colanic acid biosynthesis glycosyl transferase WcaI
LLHLLSFALSSLPTLLAQWRWQPDLVIVVAPAFFCAPGALLFSRLLARRSITWLHIQDFELDVAFELGLLKGKALRSLAERCERRTLRSFRICSSISQAMVQRLISKGVSPAATRLLPNWVDLAAIQPTTPQLRAANSYRQQFAIQPDQLVLMYSGSMNKKQGLDLLSQVIRDTADLTHIVWFLAGEGPSKAELVAATSGLPRVHHLPLQPAERLNEWLGAADIHLLPQKASAADLVLPSKLLGILASGRPVIASSPAGSELAQIAGQAGVCVAPEDPHAFASAVFLLAGDPVLRQSKGVRARRLAEQHFGRDAVLEQFERSITQLLAERDTTSDPV